MARTIRERRLVEKQQGGVATTYEAQAVGPFSRAG
jgi:hypothetical protein